MAFGELTTVKEVNSPSSRAAAEILAALPSRG
jgi:hypothetical protein